MPDVKTTNPLTRRGLLARAGLVGAAALGAGLLGETSAEASQNKRAAFTPSSGGGRFVPGDVDILTFALNAEYLEAEYFLRGVSGAGLPDNLITGGLGYGPGPYRAVAPGLVSTYATGTTTPQTGTTTAVTFDADGVVKSFAAEIANDATEHVTFLRKALGKRAPARPAVDLAAAFTAFMKLATVIGDGDTFDPFSSQRNFLLGAFLLCDIGPTFYVGAAPYLSGTGNIAAAAGILGSKSYHAGTIRSLLFALSQEQADNALLAQAGAISNERNILSINGGAPNPTDEGIVTSDGVANAVPADADSIAYARAFPALLSIYYQSTAATQSPPVGGFAPSGFNGRIR